MGIEGPRTPAVHRAVGMLDAISSGHADTPAALGTALGLAKSSIADLLGALEQDGLIDRGQDGRLHVGPRWAALADPEGLIDRLFRACDRAPDLDGHTVSVVELLGSQIVYLDVRPGLHPLPLTPRPGQRASATETAGAIAILSSVPAATAAEIVRAASAHQGLTIEEFEQTLGLRQPPRNTAYESHSPMTGRQLACAVPGSPLALTMHLPERFADSTSIRRIGKALNTASRQIRSGALRQRGIV